MFIKIFHILYGACEVPALLLTIHMPCRLCCAVGSQAVQHQNRLNSTWCGTYQWDEESVKKKYPIGLAEHSLKPS